VNKNKALEVITKARETWPRDNPPLLAEFYKPTSSWRVVWYNREDERKVYAS